MRINALFRMKKIDRYVLVEVLGPFVGGFLFFIFIFLMFQILRLADFFISHGVSGALLFKITGLLILNFLPLVFPIAFLVGVLVGFGRLSSDSELVAMKATGMSLNRLSRPVLILSALIIAVSFFLNLEWVPRGDALYKQTLIQAGNRRVAASLKEGTFTSGFFNLLVYVDEVDQTDNRLKRVFIFDERNPASPLTVVAEEGEIVSVRTESELSSAVMLRLQNGNIYSNDLTEKTHSKIRFGEYRLFLQLDEGKKTAVRRPKMWPLKKLLWEINNQEKGSKNQRDFLTELWRRIAVAFSPLGFVFLGIGYGTVRTRAVKSGAMVIALAVILVYWGMQSVGIALAQKGTLPPAVALLFPNLLILGAGIRAYRSASW